MKRLKYIQNIAIAVITLSFILVSCEDDSEIFTAEATPPVALSELPTSMIELDPNNAGNPAATFIWSLADFGQPAAENYSLQISADEAFTEPYTATSVSGTNSVTLSMGELNSAAGTVGLPPFEFNTLYARIMSSIGTQNGLPVASNSISFDVKPYFNYPFKDYYIVGNATAPDWNNNNNNPALFRDASNSNVYRYTGYFGAGEFKVLEVKGLWQPQWGTNDGSTIDVNPGDGSDPGTFPNNNSPIAAAGFYTFTINFGSNTFGFEPYDASGATTFSSMTIQGTAAGGDVAMTQLGFDSHIWFINSVNLGQGDLNFLTNTGATWAGDTSFSGQATEGGGSIPVIVQDDYDVWFNDLTGEYILIPLNL
ncbi:SusE domain-containing protein [Winogradskyella sp. A3E31]|uniref:SusE domain-containing protein n=1 Tax=Winogradskyella sp. A3E31 TaxID=3349637 RepID=UPI00398A7070